MSSVAMETVVWCLVSFVDNHVLWIRTARLKDPSSQSHQLVGIKLCLADYTDWLTIQLLCSSLQHLCICVGIAAVSVICSAGPYLLPLGGAWERSVLLLLFMRKE